jgi:hypothetical protein
MNPYILQGQPMQDVSGLQPVFQNFGQQQANQQAALAQQAQLAGQAGQTQGGGMNPLALAQALRKDKPTQDQLNAKDAQMGGLSTYNPYTQYQVSNAYGTDPYSQQSRMLAAQEF